MMVGPEYWLYVKMIEIGKYWGLESFSVGGAGGAPVI